MADKWYKKYFKILLVPDLINDDKFKILGFLNKEELDNVENFRLIWCNKLLKMLPKKEHLTDMLANLRNWLPPWWELKP